LAMTCRWEWFGWVTGLRPGLRLGVGVARAQRRDGAPFSTRQAICPTATDAALPAEVDSLLRV
jgi:hypothetical protein